MSLLRVPRRVLCTAVALAAAICPCADAQGCGQHPQAAAAAASCSLAESSASIPAAALLQAQANRERTVEKVFAGGPNSSAAPLDDFRGFGEVLKRAAADLAIFLNVPENTTKLPKEPEVGFAGQEAKFIGVSAQVLLVIVFLSNACGGGEEKKIDWTTDPVPMPLGEDLPGPGSSTDQPSADAAASRPSQVPPLQLSSREEIQVQKRDSSAAMMPGKCNYVMFFPRRCTQDDHEFRISLSAGLIGYINWAEKVPGREYARKVFRQSGNMSLVSEEEINELFQERMTTYEYHVAARKLIIRILHTDLKLACSAEPSHHADEVVLTVSTRNDPAELRRVAAQMRYQLPLSDKAYLQAETKLVKAADGQEIRGHAAFIQKFPDYFEPFRPVDLERILKTRVDHHVSMTALEEQGVLLHYFLPHSKAAVEQLTEHWADFWLWRKIPSHNIDVHLKDYFGEGMAWIYVWQTHFTQCLALPATVGAIVFWRRFSGLDLLTQRYIQLVYAAFIIVWAAYFNSSWDRLQARLATAWGMKTPTRHTFEFTNTQCHFDPSLGNSMFNRVFFIKCLTDCLTLLLVCCSVTGTLMIQNWRNHQTDKMMKMSAAMLLSVQIMVIDFTWLRLSKVIVSQYMNYRTEEKWIAGWVQRVFFPRLFNNLFPFVYIGFFKPHWFPEACPQTQAGCLEELEMNLIVYFMARVFVQLSSDVMLMMVSKFQIWLEFKGIANQQTQTPRHGSHTYVQIQSKAFPYDKQMHLEDWMDFTMTFVFVSCFSVVLPAISFLALLVSLAEFRLLAHRNLHYVRRPDPETSEGIGIWRDILEWVEILAVMMNLAIAVFVMRPMRDYSWATKWIIFVGAEHFILSIREVFKSKFPIVPLEVEEATEENHKTLMAMLAPEETHVKELVSSARDDAPQGDDKKKQLLDIGPDAFPDAVESPQGVLTNAARRLLHMRQMRQQPLRRTSSSVA